MSKEAQLQYVGVMRRRYAALRDRAQKGAVLDEVVRTTGLERKYVNKLLRGLRRPRHVHRGRPRSFSETDRKVLLKAWQSVGCPCSTYLKACIGRVLEDLAEVWNVPPESRRKVEGMSASSMERMLRGEPRAKLGSLRRNRRSGANKEAADRIPCRSGERIRGFRDEPGSTQVDTVALCGGDMADSFWWIHTTTSRLLQWTELQPAWNRSQLNTMEALRRCEARMPVPVTKVHSDNGNEYIHMHLVEYARRHARPFALSRSRPAMKNDNAHVEQKNGSVVRELFGEGRIDDPDLEADIRRLCEAWSDFVNFFRPVVMLVYKRKRYKRKGFEKRYDRPRTPLQRVLECPSVSERTKARLRERHRKTNSVVLFDYVRRLLGRIRAKQARWKANPCAAVPPGSALRAAPPGPPGGTAAHGRTEEPPTSAERPPLKETPLGAQHFPPSVSFSID